MIIIRFLLVCFSILFPIKSIANDIAVGVPAYWGDQGNYASIPSGSLAVINPNSGILDESKQSLDIAPNATLFGGVISELQSNDVDVYAYVPTGYFNHECDEYGKCQTWKRIVTQIFAYSELYPNIDGFFFDEASGDGKDCDDYQLEYSRLRGLVKRYMDEANVIFNPGWSNPCAVKASLPGEVVLTFEGEQENYKKHTDTTKGVVDLAKENGVKTWHLVHTAKTDEALSQVISEANSFGVDYLYVTDVGGNWQAGENTWGAPSRHWKTQKILIKQNNN